MSATLHHGDDNRQIQRTVRADFSRWHTMGSSGRRADSFYSLDGREWGRVWSAHVPGEPMELAIQTQAGTCGDRYAPCPDRRTPRMVRLQVEWVRA
jgi:hypothetical protein